MDLTYSSITNISKGADWLQIGQSHVGPCSCSCRYEVPSKHWLCRQAIPLHGKAIRSVDNGHFNDKTDAVATMSASRDLLTTA